MPLFTVDEPRDWKFRERILFAGREILVAGVRPHAILDAGVLAVCAERSPETGESSQSPGCVALQQVHIPANGL